ncbi:unnamed protein product [Medioppia subpectinata]|uniref:Tr-type G domain-containing protein n=1 Tax=Medioppia subpectinata TaxID=1979941 RepID=A0A7R9LGE7_9ACAR|nr:unnamed protein product [Medioppia subpectinata]CAG2118002.1 unnamed protein product [Medioppia subpectinata]
MRRTIALSYLLSKPHPGVRLLTPEEDNEWLSGSSQELFLWMAFRVNTKPRCHILWCLRDKSSDKALICRRLSSQQSSDNLVVNVTKRKRNVMSGKEHMNIGTIGHVDHGKTTLTSALTKVCADNGFSRYVS